MSVSGLSPAHVATARRRFQQAAVLGYHARNNIGYTQSAARWEGIARHRVAIDGQYPHWADCSSFASWVLWNALWVPFRHFDNVNGTHWTAGYTGTLLGHGLRVHDLLPGDLVLYGNGFPGEHVACHTGGGLVVSHGSSAGPLLLRWNYRPDVMQFRRYL